MAEIRLILCNINQKLDGLMSLKVTVSNIEEAVQMMSKKYDEVLERLERQETQTRDIRKLMDAVETQCKKSLDEKNLLQRELNGLEWRNGKLNLEFHGIQVTESENLLQKVNNLADVMSVPKLSDLEITALHRLQARPGKISGIIVRWLWAFVKLPLLESSFNLQLSFMKL
ncbi:hypothetical protein HPB51_009383 [Rhipicephalus microplus]|uniref:Uncharacterized protein n=1 Tax=Rhipicephalus microplus TaxID=6941 RepID=A0A9J6F0V0_RHIMP|nr:hypothetical protein HPB51_009383 [Rhipicephalus microplus]